MKTYTQEQVDEIIEYIHKRDMEILDDYSKHMNEFTNKLIVKTVSQSTIFGMITGAIIGLMIGSFL